MLALAAELTGDAAAALRQAGAAGCAAARWDGLLGRDRPVLFHESVQRHPSKRAA